MALKPDYVPARLNLGNTLLEAGQNEEAVAEYEKVLELEPNYILAHQNLASALNRLGRFDEAMEHMQAGWKLEAEQRAKADSPASTAPEPTPTAP